MQKIVLFLIINLFFINKTFAGETKFILQDKCVTDLYNYATEHFKDSEIYVLRDSRGINLRFELPNPSLEELKLSCDTSAKILKIEDFLAKIKNPAIIEVHTAENKFSNSNNTKNWELSAVIAGNIEDLVCAERVSNIRIHSVGYGEFLPENNTPNNGGKLLNRVDIIVLCNISGE